MSSVVIIEGPRWWPLRTPSAIRLHPPCTVLVHAYHQVLSGAPGPLTIHASGTQAADGTLLLVIDVPTFCEDLMHDVFGFLADTASNQAIQSRLAELIQLRPHTGDLAKNVPSYY